MPPSHCFLLIYGHFTVTSCLREVMVIVFNPFQPDRPHIAMPDINLIGAGKMAQAYAKVLKAKGLNFNVIGRGDESAKAFKDATGQSVLTGGLEKISASSPHALAPAAIIALPVANLARACAQLITAGTKRILVEKPAGLNLAELKALEAQAKQHDVDIRVALNRRFLAATLETERRVHEDGGVTSFTFEFTEWANAITNTKHPAHVKQNWFLANSLHVVDLAFHLGGVPNELFAVTDGALDWHSRASRFVGAGHTADGAVFSYHADWNAPGRWGVEIMTAKHRYILRPMEQLQVQDINKIAIEAATIDDALDQDYKPGLFRMVEAFIEDKDAHRLPTIATHSRRAHEIYTVMLPENAKQCATPRHVKIE